jgi:hypothetical protein
MTIFDANNGLFSDDDFQYNGTCYVRDKYSNRCYLLDASISLRVEMDGALVRRRISEKSFLENLEALKFALAERNSVNFYWTDSITGKGSYVYAEKEKAEGILQKYFEASAAPLPGVKYPKTAAPWAGTIVPKWIAEGAA